MTDKRTENLRAALASTLARLETMGPKLARERVSSDLLVEFINARMAARQALDDDDKEAAKG